VTKRTTGELLAIKRITKSEVLKKDPDLYTVRIEHAIMTRVQSPFCLNLVHVFEIDTELCFVMPFMRGTVVNSHPGNSVVELPVACVKPDMFIVTQTNCVGAVSSRR
jgi:hypothetical protein